MAFGKLKTTFITLLLLSLSLTCFVLYTSYRYYRERSQMYEKLLYLNRSYIGQTVHEVRESLNIIDSIGSDYYIGFPDLEVPGIENHDYYGIEIITDGGKIKYIGRYKP